MVTAKKLDVLDYFILIFILLISVFIGLYHGFKNKVKDIFFRLQNKDVPKKENIKLTSTNETKSNELSPEQTLDVPVSADLSNKKMSEYMTASSSMGSVPVALSLLASFYSATAILGLPAEIYQYGTQYSLVMIGMVVSAIMGAFIFGPFFGDLNIVSIFEYFEIRFDSKLVRKMAMVVYVIRNFISSAIFMYGPATSLAILTDLDEKIAIGLIGLIGTFYTTVGGIRAVIWTDLFQALIMLGTLLLILIKGVVDVDGFGNLVRLNADGGRFNFFNFDPDPFQRQTFWPIVIGMTVNFSASYCFDQQMMQRFQAARSRRTAQRALLLNVPGIVLIMTLCCALGTVLYANFAQCDPLTMPGADRVRNPNQLLSYFVQTRMSDAIQGAAGLFLGALFCGSLSSVSSSLNSQVSILWNDFFRELSFFRHFDDTKSLYANQMLVLACGALSIALSFFIATIGGNLTQISTSLNGCFNAPIIGLFLLGLCFKLTNKVGAIVGTVVGFVASCFLTFGAYVVGPVYPKLSFSVKQCDSGIGNGSTTTGLTFNPTTSSLSMSSSNNTVLKLLPEVEGFEKFFYMSYVWYTTFGVLATVIPGVLVSVATGGNKSATFQRSFILFDTFGFLKYFRKKKINSTTEPSLEQTRTKDATI